MSKPSKCDFCYWSAECYWAGGCEYWTPVEPEKFCDEYIDSYIESERKDFRESWFKYTREMLDEMFM